jgi:predicted ester cyclase
VASWSDSIRDARLRSLIETWYSLFTLPVGGDVADIQDRVVTADYQSCTGDGPGECWGRDVSIKVVRGFARSIPDMRFEIKEVLIDGNRVAVRGEVSGTPAEALFGGGIPLSGKSFRIATIDLHTIRDGKICKTYHLENWFAALGQLGQGEIRGSDGFQHGQRADGVA